MNIYENVEKRAAHALSILSGLFPHSLQRQDLLTYRTENANSCETWEIRYSRAKKWLSRVYRAEIAYTFECPTEGDFQLVWNPAKKEWKCSGGEARLLIAVLNGQKEIANQLAQVDMEKAVIAKQGSTVSVLLVPIPGCFIWTLIPPVHYFVKLKPEEAEALTRAADLLGSAILLSSREQVS